MLISLFFFSALEYLQLYEEFSSTWKKKIYCVKFSVANSWQELNEETYHFSENNCFPTLDNRPMRIYLHFLDFPYTGYGGLNWVEFWVVKDANWVCWLRFCKVESLCPSRRTKILVFKMVGKTKLTQSRFSTGWGSRESQQGELLKKKVEKTSMLTTRWRGWENLTDFMKHSGDTSLFWIGFC